MTQLPDKESSRVVLFGCGQFESADLAELPAVGRNLADLQALLTSAETGVFDKRHTVVLRDEDCAGVRSAYQVLRKAAREATDTFLVYYAGHGLTSMRRNELYLCLADTDPEALSVSGLSIDMIRDVFLDCPARNRVLVLDCCFSGRATHDYMASTSELLAGQSEITGTYTLASAPPTAASLAPLGERYTAFTGALIEMLRDGEPTGPELLTLDVLYGGLRRRMNARGFPLPTQRGTDLAHHLAIGRNPANSLRTGVLNSPPASAENDSLPSPLVAPPPADLRPAIADLPEILSPPPRPRGRNWLAVSRPLFTLVYATLVVLSVAGSFGAFLSMVVSTGPGLPRTFVYVSQAILLVVTLTAPLGRSGRLLLPAALGGWFTNIQIYQSGFGGTVADFAGPLVADALAIGVIVILLFGLRRISGRGRWARPRILPVLLFGGVALSTAIWRSAQLQGNSGNQLLFVYANSLASIAAASFAAWLALSLEQRLAAGGMLLGLTAAQILDLLFWATEGRRFSGWAVAANWITVLLMLVTGGLAIVYMRRREQQTTLTTIRSGWPRSRSEPQHRVRTRK